MLFLLFTLCLFVSLDFLVILVFSAERVASIARVNSARRRNNNFARRSRGTRTRRFRGARASQRQAGKRATDNSKLQKTKPSNARHCPGPGFATRGASSTTLATRPSAHKQSGSSQSRAAKATRPARRYAHASSPPARQNRFFPPPLDGRPSVCQTTEHDSCPPMTHRCPILVGGACFLWSSFRTRAPFERTSPHFY